MRLLEDAIGKYLLIPRADVTTLLDHPCILFNVLASRDQVARAYVLQVEVPLVLVAKVSESKVDTRAVLGGGPHQLAHDAGNVEGQLPLRSLRHFLEASRLRRRPATSVYLFCFTLLLLLAWRSLDSHPSFWLELPMPS